MDIDLTSLFIAVSICAAALALTLVNAWLQMREDRFLLTGALGITLIGTGLVISIVGSDADMPAMALAYALETAGFVILYLTARQFAGLATSRGLALGLMALALPPVVIPFLLGLDGLALMIYNFIVGTLLLVMALHYWKRRIEAPSALTAITALYVATAASFFLCSAAIIADGRMVRHEAVINWAEQFNAIMCIVGLTGIGSLSLSLTNARAAARHRRDAQTDSLTGLLNRRALFDGLAAHPLTSPRAVAIFDLDHFKSINDRYGHSVGDDVLRLFAQTLRDSIRDADMAARAGGEEFVLVMRVPDPHTASEIVERVREAFASRYVNAGGKVISCTASAGIAFVRPGGELFEDVLQRADQSLYSAKQKGRNRVVVELTAAA